LSPREVARLAHLFEKNHQRGVDLKAKDLPIVFNAGKNSSENALKTICGLSYGSEIRIINFVLQVTPQHARP
jgi:hypothetical protein